MTIYNKSSHPVEVKKISIRLWSLRDEIEAAVERRIKECEAAGIPLYIDDIKKYYNMNMTAPLTEQSNVIPLRKDADSGEGINSLMESLGEEAKNDQPQEAAETDAPEGSEGSQTPKSFNEAEEIMAEQKLQGVETKNPSPILDRPFQRQPPNLERISYGFSLLSDINMDTILCFTKDRFLQGQSVVVEFLIPQTFIVSADVTYCNHYALRSRIISSTKPDYRVQCRFTYDLAGERDNLRNFLKSIEPEVDKKKGRKDNEDDSLGI